MRRLQSAGVAFALSIPFAGVTFAQTNPIQEVRVVSTSVKPGLPVPRPCLEEATILARTIDSFPHPFAWRWIVLCDVAGWEQFLDRSGRGGEGSIYASTDLSGRTTWVRGTTLLNPDDFRARPGHVIGHELAHIALWTPDDGLAEKKYRSWSRKARGDSPVPKEWTCLDSAEKKC